MKITDLKASNKNGGGSVKTEIGDTIISVNDMSADYIDRSNEQTLNKLEYPVLWESFKEKSERYDLTNTNDFLNNGSYIETDDRFFILEIGSSNSSYNILDKEFNLLSSSETTNIVSDSFFDKSIHGDNNNIVALDFDLNKISYSNNFDIFNGVIGTFTEKVFTDKVNVIYINDSFILTCYYDNNIYDIPNYIMFKINKNELNKFNLITGDPSVDKLLDFAIMNDYDLGRNANIYIGSIYYNSTDIKNSPFIFLKNGDVFLVTNNAIYKTNINNLYNLEVWEELNFHTDSTLIKSFDNSFLVTIGYERGSLNQSLFIFNDNGVKIRKSSEDGNEAVIDKEYRFTNYPLHIDFINKTIVLEDINNERSSFNNFSINGLGKKIFFNNVLRVSEIGYEKSVFERYKRDLFYSSNDDEISEYGGIFNRLFIPKLIIGDYMDNFTMPVMKSIKTIETGTEKDKYWTKKG